jgi:DNA-binding FadR family transcriptional regulator
VEAELERMISLQLLPADGSLPSEQKLARCFGVSRSTLREALRRLSARGLVVQHPGRKTRAVALDETVTLENLSVALHDKDKANPDRWRLLEGFFALKRDMTVELLAACCERAEKADLERLEQACFALREAAHWDEEGRGWAPQEFALLRLAAQVADRPGHLLLIHSLERTFWSMASWVQPQLEAEAVDAWALCAMYALGEKNAQGLRQELPPLLLACEARLLRSHAPDGQAAGTPEAPSSTSEEPPPLLQVCEAQLLGSREPDGQAADTREAPFTTPVEAREGGEPASEAARAEPPDTAVPNTIPAEPHEGGEPAPEAAKEEPPGAAVPNLSGCRTGSSHAPPTGTPVPSLLPPALATSQSVAPGEHSPHGDQDNDGVAPGEHSPHGDQDNDGDPLPSSSTSWSTDSPSGLCQTMPGCASRPESAAPARLTVAQTRDELAAAVHQGDESRTRILVSGPGVDARQQA